MTHLCSPNFFSFALSQRLVAALSVTLHFTRTIQRDRTVQVKVQILTFSINRTIMHDVHAYHYTDSIVVSRLHLLGDYSRGNSLIELSDASAAI